MPEPFQSEHMTGQYDDAKRIAVFTWAETATAHETAAAYAWVADLMDALPPDRPLRGSIIDFSGVVTFAQDNLRQARTESKKLNQTKAEALSHLPTGLVVKTMYQEMYVRTSMRLANQDETEAMPRVRLVHSVEEAEAHIAAWHHYHQAAVPKPPDEGRPPT